MRICLERSTRRRGGAAAVGAAMAVAAMALSALIAIGASPARAENAEAGCGGPDAPCRIGDRAYFVAAPADLDGPAPLLVHLHGAGSSGRAVIRAQGFVQAFTDRGFVVLAPSGTVRTHGAREFSNWSVKDGRNDPETDSFDGDYAFLQAARAAVAARYEIDPARTLLAGFSRGGSYVWDVACADPNAYAAYAPIAGGFWTPLPADCAGPVKLLHTHGWRDMTVPLEGRLLRGGALRQGDIFAGLEVWRAENGCDNLRATEFETDAALWRRRWTNCDAGTALELALHPGGHGRPPGWPELAIAWFDAVTGGDPQASR